MKIISIMFLLIFINCSFNFTDNNRSKIQNVKSTIANNAYWVNEMYMESFKKILPDSSKKEYTYPIIKYKIGDKKITFINNNNETEETSVSFDGKYYTIGAGNFVDKFVIEGDKIKITKNNKAVFYKKTLLLDSLKENNIVWRLNLKMFAEQMLKSNFNVFDKLELNNESFFYSNSELNDINTIFTKGHCENTWIIRQNNDTVLFYDYLNSCDPKHIRKQVELKLSYKAIRYNK